MLGKKGKAMNLTMADRDAFLQNLRVSRLLTKQQFCTVLDGARYLPNAEELADALTAWKLLTRFQARMLLAGRNTGFLLGPYRILDRIGQGGMGRVYKAAHQTMDRIVALKVLSPRLVDTARARQLFLREVRAAAQLNHPNIVMAFDANEVDGRHYLAMEYVAGPNLDSHTRRHGPLPSGLACEIVLQAAAGLRHAHEKGLVHCDIKPANLLLQEGPDLGTIQVKILDFGLARLHGSELAQKKALTPRNAVLGTPDFLSPEQSKGLRELDVRSDLYSLGCTLYFLLTGQVPFPGGNSTEKFTRHTGAEAIPVQALASEVPTQVANIVRKLMAKQPDDRYQTTHDLRQALTPHAAPDMIEWPIGRTTATGTANIDLDEIQANTELLVQSPLPSRETPRPTESPTRTEASRPAR
jgi:eukaryotic-like serine/threonine-protein kinase